MPKDFGRFFSRINGRKGHFSGEISRISCSKRSLAVCTTVVQLGILRLSKEKILSVALRRFEC